MADLSVKFAKDSDSVIEGLAIPFGGPIAGKDLDGEDFGPDTDFALDWFPQGRPTIYQHGIDGAMKTVVQGRQIEHEIVDEGVWATVQLDKSAKYHETVSRLISAGKLFFSSGSMSHLIETADDGHIKRWPWVELSLTPTPANPWAAVHPVKSTDLVEHLAAIDIAIPDELVAAALKAWDEHPASPVDVGFAETLARVSDDLTAIVGRVAARKDWYTKSGRTLSAKNRQEASAIVSGIDDLRAFRDEIDALLTATDPEEQQRAASAVYLEFLTSEVRRNGITV